MSDERVLIVEVVPYIGKDSWLGCGGDHLKKTINEELLEDSGENKIMYAIIHLDGKGCTSDWGYGSVAEARKVIKGRHPGVPITVVR